MRTRTLVALTLTYASNAFGQAAHTHWEPYKNASTPPSVDQNHTDALVLAARVLRQNGFDERALDVMFKRNPARLLGLPLELMQ